jgi:serine/threonine protein kinase
MTASSPDQRLAPGAILAERYEIIERLGAGGMGTVYLARHRLMDRLCALKVLPPGHHRDAEALERFTREARNASRMVHPNVCTVYDFGTTGEGVAYLAMEYLEGRTLGAILSEQGRLPLDRAVRLTREIAAGLDAAHELGIVHRDLKPDNVMVLSTRTGETVKLVDFGIAKALEAETSGDMTAPGVVIGTPDYMSPEQFAGDPVDPRTDVYALGVMFYRMVTGGLPHVGETAREKLTKRLTEPPRSLGDAAPDLVVPAGLHSIVAKVLSRRPSERYPTAGAFAEAVVSLLTGPLDISSLPTLRLDAATAPITTAPAKRRGVIWGTIGLAGVSVAAALILIKGGSGNGSPKTGNTTASEPPAPPPAMQPPASPSLVPIALDTAPAGRKTVPFQPTRPRDTSGAASTAVPPPGPTAPPEQPVPTEKDLPVEESLDDPGTRGAARLKAEHIYDRVDAAPEVRAQAAFFVAQAHATDGKYEDAALWAEKAIGVNGSSPEGESRTRRGERYTKWLNQIRQRIPDTTGL